VSTIRMTFDEIKSKQVVKVLCRVCRKKISRTLSASQTENPYNRNAEGNPKSRTEIQGENFSKLQALVKDAMMNGLYCSEHQPDPSAIIPLNALGIRGVISPLKIYIFLFHSFRHNRLHKVYDGFICLLCWVVMYRA